jgi:hypothetical protein
MFAPDSDVEITRGVQKYFELTTFRKLKARSNLKSKKFRNFFRKYKYNPFDVGNSPNVIHWGKDSLKDLHWELGDYRLFIALHSGVDEYFQWKNDLNLVSNFFQYPGLGYCKIKVEKKETAGGLANILNEAGLDTGHKEIELLSCGAASSPCLKINKDEVQKAWRYRKDETKSEVQQHEATCKLKMISTAFDPDKGRFEDSTTQEPPLAFTLWTSLDKLGFKSLEITAYYPLLNTSPNKENGNIMCVTIENFYDKGGAEQFEVIFSGPQKNVETFTRTFTSHEEGEKKEGKKKVRFNNKVKPIQPKEAWPEKKAERA